MDLFFHTAFTSAQAALLLLQLAASLAALFFCARLSAIRFSIQDAEDDSDIKIAGETLPRKSHAQADALAAEKEADELERQRAAGNIDRARALGTALCEKIILGDGESLPAEAAGESKLRMQRRLLLAFAVISTVEAEISSAILQGVVMSTFYDTLMECVPGFYDDISESGSISFYTLCLRRGGDLPANIARTFAKLTGKEGDQATEELGESLYLRCVDTTLQTIRFYKFTNP